MLNAFEAKSATSKAVLLAAGLAALLLAGCNTVSGFGQDLQALGGAMTEAADGDDEEEELEGGQ